jgi:macrodomain Ter protein organizer (MatP/YcbG family)
MERLMYEKLIAEYTRELPVESLRKVINLLEFLHDKEKIQRRMESLKTNLDHILKDSPNLQS